MRVLLIPELYRPDEPTANGTLADATTWVRGWLDRDDAVHVYWLVPPDLPDEPILADLVYALRSLGYRDAGDPGTPVFVEG